MFKPHLLLLLIGVLSSSAIANYQQFTDFGANPGQLSASYLHPGAASDNLVVLLHGCVQDGQQLADNSGFSALAKAHKFTLLIPQQSDSNNIKRCFNWFSAQDTDAGQGESQSLFNMITTLKSKINAKQVYIVGLSAGGAMANSMLVNYPNLFTAGAVVAGIAYPCADNLIKAISCMRSGPSQSTQQLSELAQAIHPQQRVWPALSIWTGTKDTVVNRENSSALAKQWASLSALNRSPVVTKTAGVQITRWQNQAQQNQVELIEIADMGHGISVNEQQQYGGTPAAFLLPAPIAAASSIITFWRLN